MRGSHWLCSSQWLKTAQNGPKWPAWFTPFLSVELCGAAHFRSTGVVSGLCFSYETAQNGPKWREYRKIAPTECPKARRITRRPEFHYNPRHGSLLNLSVVEFSLLARARLLGLRSDGASLKQTVNANVSERNSTVVAIILSLGDRDARRTLHQLYLCYPSFDCAPGYTVK